MRNRFPRAALPWLLLLAVSAVVCAQSSDKPSRRVPKLTSDDLLASPAQYVEPDPITAAPARPAAPSRVDPGGAVVWHRDPMEASNLARPGNKLIIVDVYTDWCGWCKKMDTDIYTDPRVAALSREEVFLKLNAEDRGAGQEFARQAGVNRYPTTMILNSEGRVLDVKTGFLRTPEAFLQFIRHARASRP